MVRYVTVFILVMIFAGVLGKGSKGPKTPKSPGPPTPKTPKTPPTPGNCFSPKYRELEYKTDEIAVDTQGSSYQSSSTIGLYLANLTACVLETRVEGDTSSVIQTIYDYNDLKEYVISEDGNCTEQSIPGNRSLATDFLCIPGMATCDDYVTLGVGRGDMDAFICKMDKEEDGMVYNYTYITQAKSNFLVFKKMFGIGADNGTAKATLFETFVVKPNKTANQTDDGKDDTPTVSIASHTYCAYDLKYSITDPSMCNIPQSCTKTKTQVPYDRSWEEAEVKTKNIRGRSWEEAEIKMKKIQVL
ncbi:uncharacterized protein LOC106151807 isoform X2 [Lingula anatina]|uniref:Uncharacterized protein LOC106151807 isoform X2 n=1 Tax=Lingula anatina TaxID=7574 RepID=A0A1S3H5D7_LINAN|nr:uncharacterized protein LOC106151807 isoform X2 [Lingula anatina]|eukprot:XP_013380676.1 uncharacterized protein LOC106151807 isoform X2 [Lingula anatina]